MGRNTAEVAVPSGPQFLRDHGKTFYLTEMPAAQAEDWAVRALGAMSRGDIPMDVGLLQAGWSVVALVGLRGIVSGAWAETKPLLDEMMGCVQIAMPAARRTLVEDDIQEVATRAWLKDEVFRLHAGFSIVERLSNAMRMTGGSTDTQDQTSSSDTEMSPPALDASSQEGWRASPN